MDGQMGSGHDKANKSLFEIVQTCLKTKYKKDKKLKK
jgi:hypothetical protein